LTLIFFLVLPLMQAISDRPTDDGMQVSAPVSFDPPPPPPEEEPEPEEPEEPEEAPQLEEEPQQLTLEQLQLTLNPGVGSGVLDPDFRIDLDNVAGGKEATEALFNLADLDQRPRVTYQPSPQMTPEVRRAAPGTVYVIFIVNKQGRVESPKVQRAVHPALDRAALNAVRSWRFEPGQRGGEPVRFRMRVPVTFPKS
jgi:protein TonB